MGTRCLTRIFDGDAEVCCIYRHFDGYPDGHGKELWEFVSGLRVVNGYCSAATIPKSRMANGAGRMASKIVVAFEENDLDIQPPGTKDVGEDFEYHVKCPTIATIDVLKGDRNYDGLPAVVEAYQVSGGWNGQPRTLERVPIPDPAPAGQPNSADSGGEK